MNKRKIIQCIADLEQFNNISKYIRNLDGIEFDFSSGDFLDFQWKEHANTYIKSLSDYNGIISIHGSAFDLNPGSPDKKVVELTKYRYKQCINIANSIGASFVVFHSQLNPWIKELKIKEIKANRQIDFWNEMVSNIDNERLILLIENVYETDYRDLQMLMEKINFPGVRICLDTGHLLCSSKQGIDTWIENLKPYIDYIHLHWNTGEYDEHSVPPNKFLLELKELLDKNNINPIIALEYDINDIEKEIERVRTDLE